MLPPIDETILKSNPDFERLYKTVTSSLLNSDGSTKSHDTAAKKRDAVREVGWTYSHVMHVEMYQPID